MYPVIITQSEARQNFVLIYGKTGHLS